jgi:two-component system, NtrC family, response regulator HydG
MPGGPLSLGSSATVRHESASQSPPLAVALRLRVVEGVDTGLATIIDDGRPGRLLIGRSPACELLLNDARVSRRHAAIEIVDGKVRVSDLGSTNGTLVDHVAIVEAELRAGERITIGSTRILVEAVESDRPALAERSSFGRVLGASREMRRLYPLCEKLAVARVPILIEGETGTGKEVLAESIHEEGPRRDQPFVVFDCTIVPPNLMESELFGHERGAFTGATHPRVGVLEQAHGGTLLVDEIGDLDLSLQSKLLRALDKLEFRRVGGSKTIKVDVRIIAATRRDLDREVQAGRFRDDLFHRLAVARIELPPLRRRRGDVPLLVSEICRQLGSDSSAFDAEVFARWEQYDWPGNVRELRNAVARKVELGEELELGSGGGEEARATAAEEAVSDAVERVLALELPIQVARQRVIDEFERRYVQRVLAAHGGNVSRAALTSGIARRHFHRLLARHRMAPK